MGRNGVRRELIRHDGVRLPLSKALSMEAAHRLIGADYVDTVWLGEGWVMLVDDLGHSKALPINQQATDLYHSVCLPGTSHCIRGDVVVTPDNDFRQRA